MKFILVEVPEYPQPGQPLLLEDADRPTRWNVIDSRHGTQVGTAFAVQLGVNSLGESDVQTVVWRVD